MSGKRLLLINGSSRKKGTSYSFARTLKLIAEDMGNEADIIHAIDYFAGKDSMERMREMMMQSDIVAISAPLYADTLPYYDIWLMEKLADICTDELKGKPFFAVGQCGFPDITRIEPLLDACRYFAEDTGMKWLGGLAYGGGPMINGALMEELGEKGKKITQGFRIAMENVIKGESIDHRAQEIITIKIPKFIYWPLILMLNQRAGKLAKESGNLDYKKKVYLE